MDYWTPNREKIYRWLENDLLLPVFAEAYRGAVDCLFQKTPGHVTFICHTCRDIMNTMARAYTSRGTSKVEYPPFADQIEKCWTVGLDDVAPLDSDPFSTEPKMVSITRRAYDSVGAMLEAHQAGKSRTEEASNLFFTVFLEYRDIQRIPKRDIDEWREARTWFVRRAHLRKPPFTADVSEECKKRFLALEQILLTAADSVRTRLTALDEILQDTN
jgi:hypothetical protein